MRRRRGKSHRGRERDVEDVAKRRRKGAVRDFFEIRALSHDPLGKKKSGGKFLIIARRAHGHREGIGAEPDFEGLLDRHLIGHAIVAAPFFAADDAARANPLAFRIREVHLETIARLTK